MTAFLRRQPTLLAWPLFFALSLAFVFSRGGQFRGYWLWTADWTTGTIILLGPIAAAVAAWHARFHVKHFGPAARLSQAPFRPGFAVVGAEVALALSAQIVVVAIASVYTATVNTHPDGVAIRHFFPQFFVLAGYVAFGALIGLAVPTPYTAPLVAVAAYVIVLPTVGILPRALAKYGGGSSNPTGLRPRWSFELGHSAFGLGVVICAVVVGTWLLTRRVRPPQALVGALGLAMVGVSFGFFAHTSQDRFIVPLNVALFCDGSAPQVCLPDELEDLRGSFASLITKTAAVQQRLGVANGPRRILVLGSGTRAPAYRPGDPDRPMVLNGGVTTGRWPNA